MGLLSWILGKPPSTKYDIESCQQQGLAEMLQPYGYDFQGMAAQRIAYGYEPINWPLIIVNRFRSIALTRQLNIWEQCMYDEALQKLRDTQITALKS